MPVPTQQSQPSTLPQWTIHRPSIGPTDSTVRALSICQEGQIAFAFGRRSLSILTNRPIYIDCPTYEA